MTQRIDQNARQDMPAQRAPFTTRQRCLLLAAFVLLVIGRIPRAWRFGRFQDEEATVFLAYAWHHPWREALFRPFAGYWNLAANATTLLVARFVRGGGWPLEYAPYVTMTIALAVQALPAVLILTGRAPWLARRSTIALALLFLAVAPGIEEVFFNVLHIQFHLALCVALILALDRPGRRGARILYGLLLLIAPLCGPIALVLLPLFALRALADRDKGRFEQIGALAAGGALQLLLFYAPSPMRGHPQSPGTIASTMLLRMAAMPALGFGKTEKLGEAIFQSQVTGGYGWMIASAAAAIYFTALLLLALQRRDGAIWLLLSSLTIAIASFGFGMIVVVADAPYDLDSERYTFLPLMLLIFALAAMAMRREFKPRWLCAVMLLLCLMTGISRYPRPLPGLADGPRWAAEVAIWRSDHRHPLAVWPRPYAADLSDRTVACTKMGLVQQGAKEPRYCEAGWYGAFQTSQTFPETRGN